MFHVLIRLALLLAMLNNEGMGGLQIHDDSPKIDTVSPTVLDSFLKCGLTEIWDVLDGRSTPPKTKSCQMPVKNALDMGQGG